MMRIAIVHDWLYVLGGAEKVLSAILRCYPDADLFCLFDILSDSDRAKAGLPASQTTFMQRMPSISRRHRMYLPLMPLAIEQLDLSQYDVVISSSYAVAKGVLTGPDQLHLAYVHSPMRYAWDLQHQYLRESGWNKGLKGTAARYMLHKMRLWDTRTASGVNEFIANSNFIARRIRKVYGRGSAVIWPPVEVPEVLPPPLPRIGPDDDRYYLAASRLVPYKNVHAIVEAFRSMPNRRLVVAGTGPEQDRLKAMGVPNVEFVGFVSDARLRELMRGAEAFIFAAEEDFGILPVEVQGEGTPVLALGRGGVRETIVTHGPDPTGLFFDRPYPAAITATVEAFERQRDSITRSACHANATRFRTSRFEREFTSFVDQRIDEFQHALRLGLPIKSDAVSEEPKPFTTLDGRRSFHQGSLIPQTGDRA